MDLYKIALGSVVVYVIVKVIQSKLGNQSLSISQQNMINDTSLILDPIGTVAYDIVGGVLDSVLLPAPTNIAGTQTVVTANV